MLLSSGILNGQLRNILFTIFIVRRPGWNVVPSYRKKKQLEILKFSLGLMSATNISPNLSQCTLTVTFSCSKSYYSCMPKLEFAYQRFTIWLCKGRSCTSRGSIAQCTKFCLITLLKCASLLNSTTAARKHIVECPDTMRYDHHSLYNEVLYDHFVWMNYRENNSE